MGKTPGAVNADGPNGFVVFGVDWEATAATHGATARRDFVEILIVNLRIRDVRV